MRSRSLPSEDDTSSDTGLWILAAFGIGAGLMYLFDPQSGGRRRALLRDQMDHTVRKLQEAERVVVHDASQRAIGLMAQARRAIRREGVHPDDAVLVERVRSALGRGTSHPGAIEVSANGAAVTLEGAILAAELDALLDCVRGVRGVESVDNRLSVYERPDNIPTLQGGATREGPNAEWMRENWSPSARVLAGAAGAALAATGMLRGGLRGWFLGSVGAALFARAAANRGLASIAGIEQTPQPIEAERMLAFEPPLGQELPPPGEARH
jgi:hypothetical protein